MRKPRLLYILFMILECISDVLLENIESLGCWKDSQRRRALQSLENTHRFLAGDYRARKEAIKRCAQVANDHGYAVFALQNGGECFSGANAERRYFMYGPSNRCQEGKGGVWSNSVYTNRNDIPRPAESPPHVLTREEQLVGPNRAHVMHVPDGLTHIHPRKLTRLSKSNTGPDTVAFSRSVHTPFDPTPWDPYCSRDLDIVILMDGSGGTNAHNKQRWEQIKDFVVAFSKGFDQHTRIGIIAFGEDNEIICNLQRAMKPEAIEENLKDIGMPGGRRGLNDALKTAWREQLKQNNKSIADKVIIAMATGDLASGLYGSTQFLTEHGIRVIAVGIDKEPHYEFLQSVASYRDVSNVFSVNSDNLVDAAPYMYRDVCNNVQLELDYTKKSKVYKKTNGSPSTESFSVSGNDVQSAYVSGNAITNFAIGGYKPARPMTAYRMHGNINPDGRPFIQLRPNVSYGVRRSMKKPNPIFLEETRLRNRQSDLRRTLERARFTASRIAQRAGFIANKHVLKYGKPTHRSLLSAPPRINIRKNMAAMPQRRQPIAKPSLNIIQREKLRNIQLRRQKAVAMRNEVQSRLSLAATKELKENTLRLQPHAGRLPSLVVTHKVPVPQTLRRKILPQVSQKHLIYNLSTSHPMKPLPNSRFKVNPMLPKQGQKINIHVVNENIKLHPPVSNQKLQIAAERNRQYLLRKEASMKANQIRGNRLMLARRQKLNQRINKPQQQQKINLIHPPIRNNYMKTPLKQQFNKIENHNKFFFNTNKARENERQNAFLKSDEARVLFLRKKTLESIHDRITKEDGDVFGRRRMNTMGPQRNDLKQILAADPPAVQVIPDDDGIVVTEKEVKKVPSRINDALSESLIMNKIMPNHILRDDVKQAPSEPPAVKVEPDDNDIVVTDKDVKSVPSNIKDEKMTLFMTNKANLNHNLRDDVKQASSEPPAVKVEPDDNDIVVTDKDVKSVPSNIKDEKMTLFMKNKARLNHNLRDDVKQASSEPPAVKVEPDDNDIVVTDKDVKSVPSNIKDEKMTLFMTNKANLNHNLRDDVKQASSEPPAVKVEPDDNDIVVTDKDVKSVPSNIKDEKMTLFMKNKARLNHNLRDDVKQASSEPPAVKVEPDDNDIVVTDKDVKSVPSNIKDEKMTLFMTNKANLNHNLRDDVKQASSEPPAVKVEPDDNDIVVTDKDVKSVPSNIKDEKMTLFMKNKARLNHNLRDDVKQASSEPPAVKVEPDDNDIVVTDKDVKSVPSNIKDEKMTLFIKNKARLNQNLREDVKQASSEPPAVKVEPDDNDIVVTDKDVKSVPSNIKDEKMTLFMKNKARLNRNLRDDVKQASSEPPAVKVEPDDNDIVVTDKDVKLVPSNIKEEKMTLFIKNKARLNQNLRDDVKQASSEPPAVKVEPDDNDIVVTDKDVKSVPSNIKDEKMTLFMKNKAKLNHNLRDDVKQASSEPPAVKVEPDDNDIVVTDKDVKSVPSNIKDEKMTLFIKNKARLNHNLRDDVKQASSEPPAVKVEPDDNDIVVTDKDVKSVPSNNKDEKMTLFIKNKARLNHNLRDDVKQASSEPPAVKVEPDDNDIVVTDKDVKSVPSNIKDEKMTLFMKNKAKLNHDLRDDVKQASSEPPAVKVEPDDNDIVVTDKDVKSVPSNIKDEKMTLFMKNKAKLNHNLRDDVKQASSEPPAVKVEPDDNDIVVTDKDVKSVPSNIKDEKMTLFIKNKAKLNHYLRDDVKQESSEPPAVKVEPDDNDIVVTDKDVKSVPSNIKDEKMTLFMKNKAKLNNNLRDDVKQESSEPPAVKVEPDDDDIVVTDKIVKTVPNKIKDEKAEAFIRNKARLRDDVKQAPSEPAVKVEPDDDDIVVTDKDVKTVPNKLKEEKAEAFMRNKARLRDDVKQAPSEPAVKVEPDDDDIVVTDKDVKTVPNKIKDEKAEAFMRNKARLRDDVKKAPSESAVKVEPDDDDIVVTDKDVKTVPNKIKDEKAEAFMRNKARLRDDVKKAPSESAVKVEPDDDDIVVTDKDVKTVPNKIKDKKAEAFMRNKARLRDDVKQAPSEPDVKVEPDDDDIVVTDKDVKTVPNKIKDEKAEAFMRNKLRLRDDVKQAPSEPAVKVEPDDDDIVVTDKDVKTVPNKIKDERTEAFIRNKARLRDDVKQAPSEPAVKVEPDDDDIVVTDKDVKTVPNKIKDERTEAFIRNKARLRDDVKQAPSEPAVKVEPDDDDIVVTDKDVKTVPNKIKDERTEAFIRNKARLRDDVKQAPSEPAVKVEPDDDDIVVTDKDVKTVPNKIKDEKVEAFMRNKARLRDDVKQAPSEPAVKVEPDDDDIVVTDKDVKTVPNKIKDEKAEAFMRNKARLRDDVKQAPSEPAVKVEPDDDDIVVTDKDVKLFPNKIKDDKAESAIMKPVPISTTNNKLFINNKHSQNNLMLPNVVKKGQQPYLINNVELVSIKIKDEKAEQFIRNKAILNHNLRDELKQALPEPAVKIEPDDDDIVVTDKGIKLVPNKIKDDSTESAIMKHVPVSNTNNKLFINNKYYQNSKYAHLMLPNVVKKGQQPYINRLNSHLNRIPYYARKVPNPFYFFNPKNDNKIKQINPLNINPTPNTQQIRNFQQKPISKPALMVQQTPMNQTKAFTPNNQSHPAIDIIHDDDDDEEEEKKKATGRKSAQPSLKHLNKVDIKRNTSTDRPTSLLQALENDETEHDGDLVLDDTAFSSSIEPVLFSSSELKNIFASESNNGVQSPRQQNHLPGRRRHMNGDSSSSPASIPEYVSETTPPPTTASPATTTTAAPSNSSTNSTSTKDDKGHKRSGNGVLLVSLPEEMVDEAVDRTVPDKFSRTRDHIPSGGKIPLLRSAVAPKEVIASFNGLATRASAEPIVLMNPSPEGQGLTTDDNFFQKNSHSKKKPLGTPSQETDIVKIDLKKKMAAKTHPSFAELDAHVSKSQNDAPKLHYAATKIHSGPSKLHSDSSHLESKTPVNSKASRLGGNPLNKAGSGKAAKNAPGKVMKAALGDSDTRDAGSETQSEEDEDEDKNEHLKDDDEVQKEKHVFHPVKAANKTIVAPPGVKATEDEKLSSNDEELYKMHLGMSFQLDAPKSKPDPASTKGKPDPAPAGATKHEKDINMKGFEQDTSEENEVLNAVPENNNEKETSKFDKEESADNENTHKISDNIEEGEMKHAIGTKNDLEAELKLNSDDKVKDLSEFKLDNEKNNTVEEETPEEIGSFNKGKEESKESESSENNNNEETNKSEEHMEHNESEKSENVENNTNESTKKMNFNNNNEKNLNDEKNTKNSDDLKALGKDNDVADNVNNMDENVGSSSKKSKASKAHRRIVIDYNKPQVHAPLIGVSKETIETIEEPMLVSNETKMESLKDDKEGAGTTINGLGALSQTIEYHTGDNSKLHVSPHTTHPSNIHQSIFSGKLHDRISHISLKGLRASEGFIRKPAQSIPNRDTVPERHVRSDLIHFHPLKNTEAMLQKAEAELDSMAYGLRLRSQIDTTKNDALLKKTDLLKDAFRLHTPQVAAAIAAKRRIENLRFNDGGYHIVQIPMQRHKIEKIHKKDETHIKINRNHPVMELRPPMGIIDIPGGSKKEQINFNEFNTTNDIPDTNQVTNFLDSTDTSPMMSETENPNLTGSVSLEHNMSAPAAAATDYYNYESEAQDADDEMMLQKFKVMKQDLSDNDTPLLKHFKSRANRKQNAAAFVKNNRVVKTGHQRDSAHDPITAKLIKQQVKLTSPQKPSFVEQLPEKIKKKLSPAQQKKLALLKFAELKKLSKSYQTSMTKQEKASSAQDMTEEKKIQELGKEYAANEMMLNNDKDGSNPHNSENIELKNKKVLHNILKLIDQIKPSHIGQNSTAEKIEENNFHNQLNGYLRNVLDEDQGININFNHVVLAPKGSEGGAESSAPANTHVEIFKENAAAAAAPAESKNAEKADAAENRSPDVKEDEKADPSDHDMVNVTFVQKSQIGAKNNNNQKVSLTSYRKSQLKTEGGAKRGTVEIPTPSSGGGIVSTEEVDGIMTTFRVDKAETRGNVPRHLPDIPAIPDVPIHHLAPIGHPHPIMNRPALPLAHPEHPTGFKSLFEHADKKQNLLLKERNKKPEVHEKKPFGTPQKTKARQNVIIKTENARKKTLGNGDFTQHVNWAEEELHHDKHENEVSGKSPSSSFVEMGKPILLAQEVKPLNKLNDTLEKIYKALNKKSKTDETVIHQLEHIVLPENKTVIDDTKAEEVEEKNRLRHELEHLAQLKKKSKMMSAEEIKTEKANSRHFIEALERFEKQKTKSSIEKYTSKSKLLPIRDMVPKEAITKYGNQKIIEKGTAKSQSSKLHQSKNENSVKSNIFDMMDLNDQDLSSLTPSTSTATGTKKDVHGGTSKLEGLNPAHEVRFRPSKELSEEDFPRTFPLTSFSLSDLPKLPMEKSYVVSPPHAGNVKVSIHDNMDDATEPRLTKDDIMLKANHELKKVDSIAKYVEKLEKNNDDHDLFIKTENSHDLIKKDEHVPVMSDDRDLFIKTENSHDLKKEEHLPVMNQLHTIDGGMTPDIETRKVTVDERSDKTSILSVIDNARKRNETQKTGGFEEIFPIDMGADYNGAPLSPLLPEKLDRIDTPESELVTTFNNDKTGRHISTEDKYFALRHDKPKAPSSPLVNEGSPPSKLVNEISDLLKGSFEHSPLELRSNKGKHEEAISDKANREESKEENKEENTKEENKEENTKEESREESEEEKEKASTKGNTEEDSSLANSPVAEIINKTVSAKDGSMNETANATTSLTGGSVKTNLTVDAAEAKNKTEERENETKLDNKVNVVETQVDAVNQTDQNSVAEAVMDEMKKHGRITITDDILSEKKYSNGDDKSANLLSSDEKKHPIVNIDLEDNSLTRSVNETTLAKANVNQSSEFNLTSAQTNFTSDFLSNMARLNETSKSNLKGGYRKHVLKNKQSKSASLNNGIGTSLARLQVPQRAYFASTKDEGTRFKQVEQQEMPSMLKLNKLRRGKTKPKETLKEKVVKTEPVNDETPAKNIPEIVPSAKVANENLLLSNDVLSSKEKRIFNVPPNDTTLAENSTASFSNDTKFADGKDENITSSIMNYLDIKPNALDSDMSEPKENTTKTEAVPLEQVKNATTSAATGSATNVTSQPSDAGLVDYNDIEPAIENNNNFMKEKKTFDSTNENLLHPLATALPSNASITPVKNESSSSNGAKIMNETTSSDVKPENKTATPEKTATAVPEKLSNVTSSVANETMPSVKNESASAEPASIKPSTSLAESIAKNLSNFAFKPLDESEIQKATHLFENADATNIFDKAFRPMSNESEKVTNASASSMHNGLDELNKMNNDFPFIKSSERNDALNAISPSHDKKDSFSFKALNDIDTEESREHENSSAEKPAPKDEKSVADDKSQLKDKAENKDKLASNENAVKNDTKHEKSDLQKDISQLKDIKNVQEKTNAEDKLAFPNNTVSLKQDNFAPLQNPSPDNGPGLSLEVNHDSPIKEFAHKEEKHDSPVNDGVHTEKTSVEAPKVRNDTSAVTNSSTSEKGKSDKLVGDESSKNGSYAVVSEELYNKTQKELSSVESPDNKTTILQAPKNDTSGHTNGTSSDNKSPTTLSGIIDVLNKTTYTVDETKTNGTKPIQSNMNKNGTATKMDSNSTIPVQRNETMTPNANIANETKIENKTVEVTPKTDSAVKGDSLLKSDAAAKLGEAKNETDCCPSVKDCCPAYKRLEPHITDFAAIFANKSNAEPSAPLVSGGSKDENENVEFSNLKFASGCSLPLRVVYAIDVSEGLGSGLERGKKWSKLNNFINKISKGFANGVIQKFMVYNVEPRFLRELNGCDEDTEYFTLADDCLCDAKSHIGNPNGCSVNAPLRTESIEDWGLQGPRTGLALKRVHDYFKSNHSLSRYKNLVILVSYQDSADDITDAERSLKRDGISLVNIDFGMHSNMRRNFISHKPGWGLRHTLRHNLHGPIFRMKRNRIEDSIPKEHKFKVSFKSFRNSLGKIIKKVCKADNSKRRSFVDTANRKSSIAHAAASQHPESEEEPKSLFDKNYDIFQQRYLT